MTDYVLLFLQGLICFFIGVWYGRKEGSGL